MKIGFDAQRIFTSNKRLSNYGQYVVKVLSQHFPENEYLLYSSKVKLNKEVRELLTPEYVRLKAPMALVSALKIDSVWRDYFLGNSIRKDNLDIFHGLSNELPKINKSNSASIVTVHNFPFLRFPKLYKKSEVDAFLSKTQYASENAARVIAINRQAADDLKTLFGVKDEKISIVYQGCGLDYKREYDPITLTRIADKYKLPTDFILSVGAIEPTSNILSLVKARAFMKKKKELPIVIIGPETKHKQEVLALAKKEDISDEFIFLHNVPSEDLPKIFQLTKLFVYPYMIEGPGIPIIQALYSKVPVVANNLPSFVEAGGPDSIYVDPSHPEELGEAIINVINNPSLTSKMITKGLQFVKQFDDSYIATELMNVYRSVLNS